MRYNDPSYGPSNLDLTLIIFDRCSVDALDWHPQVSAQDINAALTLGEVLPLRSQLRHAVSSRESYCLFSVPELLCAGDIAATELIHTVSSLLLTQLQHTLLFDCHSFTSPGIFYALPQIKILTAKHQGLFLSDLASECYDDTNGRCDYSQKNRRRSCKIVGI